MTQCSAASRSGAQCKRAAIPGGTVCPSHGGAAPRVKAMAAVRAEVARWGLLGADATIDPGVALLRVVSALANKAERLAGEIEETIAAAQEKHGEDFTLERVLIRELWVTGESGELRRAGEDVRGLVKLEAETQRDLMNAAAKAISAGLAERQVRIGERQIDLRTLVLTRVLDRLGLTDEQKRQVPDAIRTEVGQLRGGHLALVTRDSRPMTRSDP